jgi:hemolysin activation/secretion protein
MPSLIRCMGLAVVLLLISALSFAQTQTERFDIDLFNIEGNTLLKSDEIEAVLKPFTGKQREYGDVQRAIEALRQRYRTGGFSVVWVTSIEVL